MFHLIANASSANEKSDRKLQEVLAVFDKAEKKYCLHLTEYAGHAANIAKELTTSNEEVCLIAIGGDGTLHEVLNGIENTEKCSLGVIPVGTGNDFAAAAGIPLNAKAAAEIIAFKAPSLIDYIRLSNGLRSINAVGSGMDVDVLKRTYSGKKTGKGKYYSAFLKSLRHFKSFNFTVEYDGKKEKHNGLIACLGNGKQIGGGIRLFPDAVLDDGYMDLLIVDYLSRFRTLLAFLKLSMGRIHKIKEVTQIRCKQAKFISDDPNYTIQAEGELYENVPLEAEIVSGKLRFFLP